MRKDRSTLSNLARIRRVHPYHPYIDVLDRVLDRGIVIEAWRRISLVGIDLITTRRRVVVTSIETYLPRVPHLPRVTPARPLPRAA